MIDIGWIKLHRKLIDWEWYKDVNTFKLFIHLLLKSNIELKKWQGQTIERGQLVTSIKNLSYETGLTEKEVRTALTKLEKTKEVGKQTTSVNTTLTMVNYELYQSMGKQNGRQKANEGQTKGERRATTKEEEEYKEYKEDKKESKTFTPPILENVKLYFIENGYSEQSAEKAFNYYNEGSWKDSKGNAVKNWKQKMISVWFKDENKVQAKKIYDPNLPAPQSNRIVQ